MTARHRRPQPDPQGPPRPSVPARFLPGRAVVLDETTVGYCGPIYSYRLGAHRIETR
jgi:hypothetical protein